METLQYENNTGVLNNHRLTIKPQGLNGRYGCMITFDDGSSKNQLRYKLIIKHVGEVGESIHQYKIYREPAVFINDKEPDNFIDELAIQVSSVLYPLEVRTSLEGTFTQIVNFEEVLERWEKEKKIIEEQHKGALVDQYIQQTDHTLSSYHNLLEKISKDWFISLYFSSLYTSYFEEFYQEKSIKYPIAGKAAPVSYSVNQKIMGEEECGENDIRVKIKGKINDERCALDLEQGLDSPYYKLLDNNEKDLKGTCDIFYLLNKESGIVEGFEANFIAQFSQQKKVSVKMFLQEQLYHQENTIDDSEEKAKKGFWSKLFNR